MAWSKEHGGARPLYDDDGSYETDFEKTMEGPRTVTLKAGEETVRIVTSPLTGYSERHGDNAVLPNDETPEGLTFSA